MLQWYKITCVKTLNGNQFILFSNHACRDPPTKLFRSHIQVIPAHSDTFSEKRNLCGTHYTMFK